MCLVAGCASPKVYERHMQAAYDETGQPRPGYYTLNVDYLNALHDDLTACYAKKSP